MPRRLILLVTLVCALAVPALAHANAYTQVLSAYQRLGAVPACKFSSRELANAIKQEDTFGAEYFADFTGSIQAALEARASGQCSAHKTATGASGSGAGAGGSGAGGSGSARSGSGAGAGQLGSLTAATDSGVPAPILLMGIIALIVALCASGLLLARWFGWDPAWAASWRHACAESGYRLSATWAEFTDWLRSGDRRRSAG